MRIPSSLLFLMVTGLASCKQHEGVTQDKMLAISELMEAPSAAYAPSVASSPNNISVAAAAAG